MEVEVRQAELVQERETRLTEPRRVLPRPLVIVPSDRPVLRPYTVSTCWAEAPDLSELLDRPDLDPAYLDELETVAGRVCVPTKTEEVFGDAGDPPADAAPLVQTGLDP
ncbi:MAG TPA: hypothetical protein VM422_13875 [Amaricoccus sp.]|nr:hypothetical protein [Amaricoccus sp.]